MTNEHDVLSPEREKPLNPWQPERDALRLAVLGKLLEELGEATAIVARCIIQGIDEVEPTTGMPNRTAAEDEFADAVTTIGMAAEFFCLDTTRMRERGIKKRAHLERWHALIAAEGNPDAR